MIELCAMLRHRMVADGEAGAVKIGDQALFVVHRVERREKGSGIGSSPLLTLLLEESACGTAGAFHLPQALRR